MQGRPVEVSGVICDVSAWSVEASGVICEVSAWSVEASGVICEVSAGSGRRGDEGYLRGRVLWRCWE